MLACHSHKACQSVWIDDDVVVKHPHPVSMNFQCLLLADGRTSCRPDVVFQTDDIDMLRYSCGGAYGVGGPIVDDNDTVGSP